MKIRTALPEDAGDLQKIYAPYVLNTSISFETEVPSVEEMRRRVAASLEKHTWLVAEESNGVVGYAYSSRHRERSAYQWSTDVSIYLAEQAQGKGIARRLYEVLFAIIALQGFFKCYAGIALPNPKSVRLHEAFGFKCLGQYKDVGYKNGSWHTVGWWEKTLRPPTAQPAPTTPLALLDPVKVQALL